MRRTTNVGASSGGLGAAPGKDSEDIGDVEYENPLHSKKHGIDTQQQGGSRWIVYLFLICILFVVSVAGFVRIGQLKQEIDILHERLASKSNDKSNSNDLSVALVEAEHAKQEAARLQQQVIDLESQLSESRRSLSEAKSKISSLSQSSSLSQGKDNIPDMKKIVKRIQKLESWLSETTKTMLKLKYGNGPVVVKMETSYGDMKIQLAPFDQMPVAVWYFLQKVEEGYWDGNTFFRTERHVIQATTQSVDGRQLHSDRSVFSSIPFQEYHPEFKAHKFALGLAGRPGGPDFYVNMENNYSSHGPGGQGPSFELPGENPFPDVTFGNIIEGSEVALKIQGSPKRKDGPINVLIERVEIKTVRIVQ